MDLGGLIRQGRKNKKLTQKELGKLINVSFTTVSQWEKNVTTPSATDFIKMIEVLDILTKVFPHYPKASEKSASKESEEIELIDVVQLKQEFEVLKKRVDRIENKLRKE